MSLAGSMARRSRRLGIQVSRARFGQVLEADLARLLPAAPNIVDLGANDGGFAIKALGLRPLANVLSFEPNPHAAQRFRDRLGRHANVRLVEAAVAPENGSQILHVMENDVGSSLLSPETGEIGVDLWRKVSRAVRVRTTRLDSALRDDSWFRGRDIDLLKSDVQGFDLDAVCSLGSDLAPHRVRLVLMEVNFERLYENQCSFDRVIKELRVRGFALAGLYDHVRNERNQLRWADALFIAETGLPLPQAAPD